MMIDCARPERKKIFSVNDCRLSAMGIFHAGGGGRSDRHKSASLLMSNGLEGRNESIGVDGEISISL